MTMRDNNYDEYQMINRQKIAFRTLVITLILVFLNGMITEMHEWATPTIQATLILELATGYFITCAIFKNAYLSRKVKNPYANAILFAILGISNVVAPIVFLARLGSSHLISDGKLTSETIPIMPLILGVFFLYISAIIFIKALMERRQNDDV